MRRAKPNTVGVIHGLLVVAACAYVPAVFATDVLNCHSGTWALTIAVGSDGYVNSLLMHNKTDSRAQEPFVISNFVEGARHVDLKAQHVDVKANAPAGTTLIIRLKGGTGRIEYLGTSEQLACDWTT